MSEQEYQQIRKAILQEIKKRGITVNKLAIESGVSRSVASDYLNLGKNCTVRNVEKMLKTLKLQIKK